jgi:hypothetical protein
LILGILACSLAAIAMSPAYAATLKSSNTLYLDATGNVIGESILYCDNSRARAGVTSSNYTVTASEGCGIPSVPCDGCGIHPGDTSISVITSAATGLTISEACFIYFGRDCPDIDATLWVAGNYGFPYP